MTMRAKRFNIYLAAALATTFFCGCSTEEKKREKQFATIRAHMEITATAGQTSQPVSIPRDNPVVFNVSKTPVLNEGDVKEVKVVSTTYGGYALSITFNKQGQWLLESFTVANKGKRLAFFSQFPDLKIEKTNVQRWLAAPKLNRRITDGVIVFTPDASVEEMRQIARCLNNVIRDRQSKAWIKEE
jgi:preprotein translocase subunit SecD